MGTMPFRDELPLQEGATYFGDLFLDLFLFMPLTTGGLIRVMRVQALLTRRHSAAIGC